MKCLVWVTLFCLAIPFAFVGLVAGFPDRGVRV